MNRSSSMKGSLLVCVLVVLVVTGSLTMWGLRLVLAAVNSQQERAKVLQAQELVQLGRLVLEAQAPADGVKPKEIAAIEMDVPSRLGEEARPGLISFERVSNSDLSDKDVDQWRITARFPYNQSGEIVASGLY